MDEAELQIKILTARCFYFVFNCLSLQEVNQKSPINFTHKFDNNLAMPHFIIACSDRHFNL